MLDLDAKREELLARAEQAGTAELLNDLGTVEAMRGAADDAVAHLRAASLLDPANEDVVSNLEQVLASRAAVARPDGAGRTRVVPVQGGPADEVDPDDPQATADDVLAQLTLAGQDHEWRRRRLTAIVQHHGAAWFAGARVLELGCGYGDVGATLLTLGADVTFSDGRQEHLDVVAARYPSLPADRLVRYDAEDHWPFEERFDLVVNMGLVHHVDHWRRSIVGAMRSADHLVLEAEVCDSADPEYVVKTAESGPGQALSGTGSRPSAAFVERVLRDGGFRHERVADSRCNAGPHRYDWPLTGSGGWEHGQRRFWFARRA